MVREKLYSLFEEYLRISPTTFASTTTPSASTGSGRNEDIIEDELDEFDSYESQHYGLYKNKSQLDLYLEEQRIDRRENVDVLNYWKENKVRYPDLSSMARDILSIPISTVASESAFSTGGQIIDKYRSNLLPKNVEALLCTRDWLMNESKGFDDSEEEELVEDFGAIVDRLDSYSTRVD